MAVKNHSKTYALFRDHFLSQSELVFYPHEFKLSPNLIPKLFIFKYQQMNEMD